MSINYKKIIISILSIYYLFILSKSDSYIEPYILIGILANYGLYKNIDTKVSKLDIITSIFLSLCISLANYNILNIINFILITCISYFLFKEILILVNNISIKKGNDYNHHIFLYSFLIIFIVDLFILIFARFPGTLSPDSIEEIRQIIKNDYTNHHPYYYTQIIRLCLFIGNSIFNNPNKAIATYSFISITLMSFSISYTINTIYKISNNLKLTIIILLFYLLMPYNIEFSYTMWKDVLFSLSILIYIVSLYNLLKINNNLSNYLILIISSLGICLLRSNGFFVYILCTILFIILFKDNKKLIISFIAIIIVSYLLKGPLLNIFNVSKVETIESLSIPTQQISRVISDRCDLNDKEVNLLNNVIDISLIPDTYNPGEFDNVKNLIKEVGNQDYLKDHKLDFIKLYIELGFKYPLSYISAFIDQTKGYYNSGYEFFRYGIGVEANDYGIKQVINNELIYKLFNGYSFKLFDLPIFRLFVSIGLHFWISVIVLWHSIKKNNKLSSFINLPNMFIILSLSLATPVYCEFRYAYALFITLPFIIVTSFLE